MTKNETTSLKFFEPKIFHREQKKLIGTENLYRDKKLGKGDEKGFGFILTSSVIALFSISFLKKASRGDEILPSL